MATLARETTLLKRFLPALPAGVYSERKAYNPWGAISLSCKPVFKQGKCIEQYTGNLESCLPLRKKMVATFLPYLIKNSTSWLGSLFFKLYLTRTVIIPKTIVITFLRFEYPLYMYCFSAVLRVNGNSCTLLIYELCCKKTHLLQS